MSINVRRMVPADMAAVRHVAQVTWAHTYQGIIPEPVQAEFLRRAYADAALERRMRRDVFLVAERARTIVGFADFYPVEPGLAELAAIYVLPEAQSAGAGSQLLATGLRALPQVRRIRLDVERDNLTGRRFYAARGFEVISETIEQFAGHDLHIIKMELRRPAGDEPSGRTSGTRL